MQLRHTRSDVGFLCEVFDAKFFSLETRLVFVARHCDRDGCHGGLLVHLELASRSDTQLQVQIIKVQLGTKLHKNKMVCSNRVFSQKLCVLFQ